jgi:hypothetical protein
MDNLLDAPSSSIAYRDVRAAIAAKIRSVMLDPVVETFCNLRGMTANEIARFDPLCLSPPGGPLVNPDDFDDSSIDSTTGRRKLRFCTAPKYFYTMAITRHQPSTVNFSRMSSFARLADVWFR